MSSAIAAARKRRAPPPVEPSPSQQLKNGNYQNQFQQQNPNQFQQQNLNQNQFQQQNSNVGLTLPQVIEVVDKRLIILETANKTNLVPANLTEILNEYNSRHEILAEENQVLREEISNLKNTMLQLQTFTMDVNKKLVNLALPSL
jgi:hypothetical protein